MKSNGKQIEAKEKNRQNASGPTPFPVKIPKVDAKQE